MSSLIFIDAVVAISSFIGFGVVYSFIIFLPKDALQLTGYLSLESDQVIKCLQEGLGGIRDVQMARRKFIVTHRRSIVPQKRSSK